MRFKFVSVIIASVVIVACSSKGSDLHAAVSDAIYMSTRSQDPPFEIGRGTADCVADGLLEDKANRELLQEALDAGKTGTSLTDVIESDETETLMNCMNKDEIATIMEDVFIANLTDDAEALKCMVDSVKEFKVDELREMFIGIAENNFETDAFLKFSDTMANCGVEAEPTTAEITNALAQALFEANQANPDAPFTVSEAEAQCVAEILMSDPELNAVYTQAFKDGKTGKDFVKTDGADSDKSTIASINCLGEENLVSAMGSIIKDSTAATDDQIACFEEELAASVNVVELRSIFLDLQDDVMTDPNAEIINAAANKCGIAG